MTFALSGRRHLQCGTQYTFMKPTSCLVCQNDTLDEAYASSMWVKITLHQEKVALPGHFPGTIDSLSMAMSPRKVVPLMPKNTTCDRCVILAALIEHIRSTYLMHAENMLRLQLNRL